MKKKSISARMLLSVAIVTVLTLGMYSFAVAHCDTLDGPVIQDARKALEAKDVTPVLKWVKQKDEKIVRAAYDKSAQRQGQEKRRGSRKSSSLLPSSRSIELAKVHPLLGLKPAGEIEPAIAEADKALAEWFL